MGESWMNMVNTTYNSSTDMINKLQRIKGKTELKFYENSSNFYNNMNIKFDEDPFAKNAQGISKIYHKVLELIKFLRTKPQVKNMNNNYYDLYYTVIRNRKYIVDSQYENDFISLNDIVSNHYNGKKNNNEILKKFTHTVIRITLV